YADDLMMGLRSAGLSGHWRDELVELRRGLWRLEEQLRNFVPPASDRPRIAHVPIRRALPGQDLVLRASAWGPAALRSVRGMCQVRGQGGEALPLQPDGPHAHRLLIPRTHLVDGAIYTLVAEDIAGRRVSFPAGDAPGPIRVVVSEDQQPPTLVHAPIRR